MSTTAIATTPEKKELTTRASTKKNERNDLNGLIVKQPKSNKIYLIDRGRKRLISRDALGTLFISDVKIYEDLDIPLIKDGYPIPEDAFLFHCDEPHWRVFLRDTEWKPNPGRPPSPILVKRHIVDTAVMYRYEFDKKQIRFYPLPESAIKWPDGQPIINPPEL